MPMSDEERAATKQANDEQEKARSAAIGALQAASEALEDLLLPGIASSRIYVLDTKPDPRSPKLVKTIEAKEIADRAGASAEVDRLLERLR